MKQKRSRGQTLILAALTISIAILATQAYMYQLKETKPSTQYDALSEYVLSIETGSKNVLISSLINITQGGLNTTLQENINRWMRFAGEDYQYGWPEINATVVSDSPYFMGIRMHWGNDSIGVSSASTDFNIELTGRGVELNNSFNLNLTTTILVSGSYQTLDLVQQTKLVTVKVNMLNEDEPAFSGNMSIIYYNGSWVDPSGLEEYFYQDYGNGTYEYVFSDVILGTQVQVLIQAYDSRNIFVRAGAFLSEE